MEPNLKANFFILVCFGVVDPSTHQCFNVHLEMEDVISSNSYKSYSIHVYFSFFFVSGIH